MKTLTIGVIQLGLLLLVLAFWASAPASWVDNPLTVTAVSVSMLSIVQLRGSSASCTSVIARLTGRRTRSPYADR